MISKIFWVLAFSYTIAKVLLHDCQVMSILASFFFFFRICIVANCIFTFYTTPPTIYDPTQPQQSNPQLEHTDIWKGKEKNKNKKEEKINNTYSALH